MLSKLKSKKVIISTLFISLVIPSVFALAASTLVATTVPNTLQAKSYWCWNGSSVAVLANKGKTVTQAAFSTTVKGNSTNNSTATSTEVKTGLSKYGYSSTLTTSLSTGTVRTELSNSRPIIAGYLYKSGGGHMVVISGHDSSTNYLQVMDPGSGSKVNYLSSYFTSNSTWTWAESLYNIK